MLEKMRAGKYRNRTVAWVVLNDPRYIAWLRENSDGPNAWALAEARRLIAIFDAKPMTYGCQGSGCSNKATRLAVRPEGSGDGCYCATCRPVLIDHYSPHVQTVSSYGEMLARSCEWDDRATRLKRMVRELAAAKGLKGKWTVKALEAFFG